MPREKRAKTRMKFLVAKIGIEEFREKVFTEREQLRCSARLPPPGRRADFLPSARAAGRPDRARGGRLRAARPRSRYVQVAHDQRHRAASGRPVRGVRDAAARRRHGRPVPRAGHGRAQARHPLPLDHPPEPRRARPAPRRPARALRHPQRGRPRRHRCRARQPASSPALAPRPATWRSPLAAASAGHHRRARSPPAWATSACSHQRLRLPQLLRPAADGRHRPVRPGPPGRHRRGAGLPHPARRPCHRGRRALRPVRREGAGSAYARGRRHRRRPLGRRAHARASVRRLGRPRRRQGRSASGPRRRSTTKRTREEAPEDFRTGARPRRSRSSSAAASAQADEPLLTDASADDPRARPSG